MSLKIYSPANGQYVRLENVNDPTFSSGVMGPGFGVEPQKGVVYAPADGTVSMVFPTGHAMGFTTENGLEILIHIGINTVDLNGKGFKSNLAVSGAVLAYALKMKPGEQKSAAVSTGLVCILGITEPALYGIALPEKKPLYAAMGGGAIAGALAMILGVVTYAFSMPGITSIATYMDDGNNFLLLLIVMAVAWVSGFAISFVLTKKED